MKNILCISASLLALALAACQKRPIESPAEPPTFLSEWSQEGDDVSGSWGSLHAVAPDRLRLDHDPSNVADPSVIRVEVRPGDKVGGWSGERSEVSGMQDAEGRALPVAPASGREYYGLSIKLDAKWAPPEAIADGSTWGIFFQLHGPDDLASPPSFALTAEKGFQLNLCAGDLWEGSTGGRSKKVSRHPFSEGSLNLGRWTQFLIEVVWAADNTGSVIIQRRDEGKNDWTKALELQGIPTLQYRTGQPVGDHYWKAGFYRSESKVTSLLWLGPIVRGTNRNEVAKAAFGRP